jgi:hypothetical protein
MRITGQTLALVAVASGVFGGAVGSLATAVTSSSASPSAIASAVQRVQVKDSAADSDLAAIKGELESIQTDLHLGGTGGMGSAAELLHEICENTAQGTILPSCGY